MIDEWNNCLRNFAKFPALSVKRNNKWITLSFEEYYNECMKFAKSLLALNLPEFSTVTIIGFNSPEWLISFFGAVFARCIPAGIYQTNSQETCKYIIRHSESTIVVA